MSKVKDGGITTAYGAAVRGGYEGTYAQFCADLGKLAEVLSEFLGFSVNIETLAEGEVATASYDGGILSLGIPRGNTGNGIQSIVLNADYTLTVTYTNGNTWTSGSIRGQVGATPHLTIGTVQTLEPGQSATAEITGTDENPVLNFGIPKGQAGASDAGSVSYDPEGSYDEGTVGAELQEQNRQISDVESDFNSGASYEEIIFSAPELKQYIVTNGSTVQWNDPSTSSFTFIQWAVVPCVEGDAFLISGKGGNGDRLWAFANSQKQILSRADTSVTATNLSLIAPQNVSYLIINTEIRALSFKVLSVESLSSDIAISQLSIPNSAITKGQTEFINVKSTNLVNMQELEVGVVTNSAYSGQIDGTQTNWVTTDYIPVIPEHNYYMYMDLGVFYGQGDRGVPYYSKEKQYLGRVLPHDGLSSSEKLDYVTIPNDDNIGYIRTSFMRSYANTPKLWYKTMIVEGAWPGNMYITYDGDYRLRGAGLEIAYSEPLNCLFGKSALWNGDSICAADNDSENGGWPQRIATANGMRCKNYAIAGGTITENTTAAHSVSATLDTMISDFPDADYIIIEGGTNDADILGDSGIGTFDPNDFTAEYLAALDRDTFSGAVESVFYRLVTQMKGKHIGYLIPQKMGHTEVLVTRRRTYFDRAIAIAQKWGVPVLDLWTGSYFNWRLSAHWDQTMTSAENEEAGNLYMDGQHLTTTGYAIQSPIIAEWMKTI